MAGVRTKEAANAYLREQLCAGLSMRALARKRRNLAVRSWPTQGASLDEVLCVQEDRQVGRDNCVSWSGRSLQIPAQQHRHHYVKATVRVKLYTNGSLSIFDGPRCLARYDKHAMTQVAALGAAA